MLHDVLKSNVPLAVEIESGKALISIAIQLLKFGTNNVTLNGVSLTSSSLKDQSSLLRSLSLVEVLGDPVLQVLRHLLIPSHASNWLR